MPHKIRVAVIGEGEYLPRLICAILDRDIIPAENMFLSSQNAAACDAAQGRGVTLCEDDTTAVVKSEIVLVCASKREFSTILAPISQCTRGRVIVAVSDSPRVDLDFVAERVASGTEIITATLTGNENGTLTPQYAYGRGVRLFLHQPCRDLVESICGQ